MKPPRATSAAAAADEIKRRVMRRGTSQATTNHSIGGVLKRPEHRMKKITLAKMPWDASEPEPPS